MPTQRSPKAGFSIEKLRPLFVSEAHGKVVAVLIPIEHWIALLEKLVDHEERSRPKSKLDDQLAELARERVGKKKTIDLDDIGFIGTGRAMSEAESLLVSAYIQAAPAKRVAGMRKVKLSRAKRATRAEA
ncbi:MAG: hypothetical protein IPJ76_14980 [Flavobacteriales bacterium]|nr:MAG: hypothetical protein IPJ76_14980 [Flavobacteriales bacterium]